MEMTLLYVLVALAVAAIVLFLLASIWKSHSKNQAGLRAALTAQIGRESDELDLDKRMGVKDSIAFASRVHPDATEETKVAFRQMGHGPDILCLHGIGASMIIYRRLVPWLAGDHRVTCIDFPGFGSSSKSRKFSYSLDEQAVHLAQVVDALNLDRPLVIASSMGAAISLATALATPGLFRGLVALGPAVDPKRVPLVLLPLAKFGDHLHRVNSLAAVRSATGRAAIAQVINRRELITPSLVALYLEPFGDKGDSSSAFLKAFALLADVRMPKIFGNLETPLLIIRGLRDRLVKQAACEDLHRIVRNSKLMTHPAAGHHIMEDEPEFVALEVRKFDAEIP